MKRGLSRCGPIKTARICVDERSFQKRHEYVTIVTRQSRGQALYGADGRTTSSLEPFFEGLEKESLEEIEVVAMNMHWPFINAAAMCVPDLGSKLCLDPIHVAQHFGLAVDKARRLEHKQLSKAGDERLKGTKYHWLKAPKNLSLRIKRELDELRDSALLVAKVWAVKEAASKLWHYKSRTSATTAWTMLLDWADTIECEPLQKVVKTMRFPLLGIVNAIVLKTTNAGAESVNSKV